MCIRPRSRSASTCSCHGGCAPRRSADRRGGTPRCSRIQLWNKGRPLV